MSDDRISSFAEFWPYYLGEHRDRTCRGLHYVGSTLGLICLGSLIATRLWWFFPLGLVCGYAFAWIGHFFFEENRPATFKYPLWSFAADWKMYALFVSGKIGGELEKLPAVEESVGAAS